MEEAPAPMGRQYSYDSQNPNDPALGFDKNDKLKQNDANGIEFFAKEVDIDGAFKKYLTFSDAQWRDKNVVDTYQMDSSCINDDLLKGIEKNKDKQNNDYTQTCYTQKLDALLEKAPVVKRAFKVYRCYKHGFSTAKIDAQPNLEVYSSSTLSKRVAVNWCATGTEGQKFVICIIIPEGTKGILPIVVGNFENTKINEVLLHRKGKLYNTNKQIGVKPDNMAVYIYQYGSATPPTYLPEYDNMFEADEVPKAIVGGKSRKNKRRGKTRRSRRFRRSRRVYSNNL